MAIINPQNINRAGVETVFVAAASVGDEFANDGQVELEFKNAHATEDRTITIAFYKKVDGHAVTPRTITIPALTHFKAGPWGTEDYGERIKVSYSDSAADLTVASSRF